MNNPPLVPFFMTDPIVNTSCRNDDLKSFGIDELIKDLELDSERQSIPDEYLYDAVNDETFGAELATADDDLAEFSFRAANLELSDDEASIAIEPPDPSQIPIPQIGIDSFNFGIKDTQFTASDERRNDDDKHLQPVTSIWSMGSFNGIGSLTEQYIGLDHHSVGIRRNLPLEHQSPTKFLANIGPPPGLDKPKPIKDTTAVPMSAEELERKLLKEATQQNNAIVIGNSNQPSRQGLMDSSELERRLLEEAHALAVLRDRQGQQQEATPMATQPFVQSPILNTNMAAQFHNQHPAIGHMLMHKLFAPQMPGQLTMGAGDSHPYPQAFPSLLPPQHMFQFQHWQRQQLDQFIAAAAVAPQAMLAPSPEVQPPPIFFPPSGMAPMGNKQSYLLHCQDGSGTSTASGMHFPGSSMVPPPGFPVQLPNLHSGISSSPQIKQPGVLPQFSMVPASLHPRTERRRYKNGLPSGKTISDYALDPYAGLMSTKEREWLIKIHIIQCTGSGDPQEDDYYYTIWKKLNILCKAPDEWKNKEKPKYYAFEATYPSSGYTAPSFFGSLGKPVHSSSSQPRQIIEVRGECDYCEEELLSGRSAANRQRRLRAILMKIENAALMLIDCKDIRRKLHFFEETRITEYLDKSEITDRTQRFKENVERTDASLFSVDSISTVMSIQKGRKVVYDWLSFFRVSEKDLERLRIYLHLLLVSIGKFAKKLTDECFKEFVGGICSHLLYFSRLTDVLYLLESLKLEYDLLNESKLVQLTLLHLLTAVIVLSPTNGNDFSFANITPLKLFFSLPASALKVRPTEKEDLELFSIQQWTILKDWLQHLKEKNRVEGDFPFSKGSVARWIIQY